MGGMMGTEPHATTTAFLAVSVRTPDPSFMSTWTARSPASRPCPRNNAIPVLSSHGVWVWSLQSLVM